MVAGEEGKVCFCGYRALRGRREREGVEDVESVEHDVSEAGVVDKADFVDFVHDMCEAHGIITKQVATEEICLLISRKSQPTGY